MIVNGLSIDLEEWFHAELVRTRMGDPQPTRRVASAVEPILDLLRRHNVLATFFVVGDVLQHHPELVQRIHRAGHEIGCHGWSHLPLWALTPQAFAEELVCFDREVAGILPAEQVVGFRAPTFSLDARSAWALDVLRERGYRYDSSVFPFRTYLYGVDDCPPHPYRPTSAELTTDHANGGLIEFPMTTFRVAGFPVPVSGGFYLRILPLPVLSRLLQRINARGRPFVLYLHPWEADAETPRIGGLSPVDRFVTYHNAGTVLPKLEALLRRFAFAPLRRVLGIEGGRSVRPMMET